MFYKIKMFFNEIKPASGNTKQINRGKKALSKCLRTWVSKCFLKESTESPDFYSFKSPLGCTET